MATIKVYRKAVSGGKGRAPGKAKRVQVEERIDTFARVKRPSLQDFFLSGDFAKLPALSPQVIDNRPRRITDHAEDGWEVPVDSLGRKGTADASQAQSILLWVKKNLADVVNPEEVSVVVE